MSNPPTMTNPQRALQLWSLLTLAAMTRTILTYEEVAKLTGLPQNSGSTLGHLYFYCAKHDLPLLSALVVQKDTGRPHPHGPYESMDIPAEHRRCFAHDWLNTAVPSLKALEDAYKEQRIPAA